MSLSTQTKAVIESQTHNAFVSAHCVEPDPCEKQDQALATKTDTQALDEIEETKEATTDNRLSILQFIQDFGTGLCDAVRVQNPPIFTGEHTQRAQCLTGLKRPPFAAQAKVIQAITQLLLDQGEKAAIINGEMGTGKTLMGIATAALLHQAGYPRTLVISPPHLVYKWRREILETLPDAQVVILNGSDTLKKLHALSEQPHQPPAAPTFYIMGRVRMRMGHHWRSAIIPRRFTGNDQVVSQHIPMGEQLASCPQCGAFVRGRFDLFIPFTQVCHDKKYVCQACLSPLWTAIHPKVIHSTRQRIEQGLQQLPGIGRKMADRLIQQFGEKLLADSLDDNLYQLIQLMDNEGEFVFSDKQARRLERAMETVEVQIGQTGYQASEYIKRYLPKGFFSLLLVDEAHEYKNLGSAQGQAMGVLASCVDKVLLLTGTLMGGYADDLFYLLWRILPHRLIEDGYRYSARGSLAAAATNFLETHGILKEVRRTTDGEDHRTARGKREHVQTSKAPGFGPKGIARYLLPYTAFLKLKDIDQNVLPPYREHFVYVDMTEQQADSYAYLEAELTDYLKKALASGDHSLLGVVLNALLAWPDSCFREECVLHPRTRRLLLQLPALLEDEPTPKEQQLLALCQEAKRQGRRTLVYTIYTGRRDTTLRLKHWLDQQGFKTSILRASVSADKREAWIAEQIDKGIDVLICHPELVKTGLDLLAFSNIVFLQSGYNVYTLMQAARRSWRIGQQHAVDVYFLGYENTAQIQCLSLMAKKIAVTQSTAGTMPETGLDILNQEADSVEVALAKQLIA